MKKNIRVLLIIEQCNPEQPSVPLVGYNFFREINKRAEVTLATQGRNEIPLKKVYSESNIIYFHESPFSTYYCKLLGPLTRIGGVNWPLIHALFYPIYAEFNNNVYRYFRNEVLAGKYDIVHAFTPIVPRYPVKIIKACANTPFILGPVNGGLPFPKNFEDIEKKEFSYLNTLRALCYLIPGYSKTYKKADKILAGSTYTLEMIKSMFNPADIELFYENGVMSSFFNNKEKSSNEFIQLLFVGRLVPYKGAEFLIDAIYILPNEIKRKIRLTIVGDGPEKQNLINLVNLHHLQEFITFTGWIEQEKTLQYYQQSDIFCFPSLREFGGAVVLEAMAGGLPCIVIENGGIAEYVTNQTGFKIEPKNRAHIVSQLVHYIQMFVENPSLRKAMSESAIKRAKEFEWSRKGDQILEIYEKLIKKIA